MTISAVKPVDIPRWASVSPGTVRLAPSSGQQDTGWTNTQRPPFNVMNWLQGVQYDWQQYLEDATDQLESSKINKTGATDLSGTFRPTASGGASFGAASQPLGVVITNQLDLKTDGVLSSFNPSTTNARTLGTASKRWLSGDIATLTSDVIGCPSATVTLAAPSTNLTTVRNYVRIDSAGVGGRSVVNFSAGVDGQTMTIMGVSTTFAIPNGSTVRVAGGTTVNVGKHDTITFVYDATLALWLQTSFVDNPGI